MSDSYNRRLQRARERSRVNGVELICDDPLYLSRCGGKRGYSTKRQAKQALREAKRGGDMGNASAYFCRDCGGYHIGKDRRRATGLYA